MAHCPSSTETDLIRQRVRARYEKWKRERPTVILVSMEQMKEMGMESPPPVILPKIPKKKITAEQVCFSGECGFCPACQG
jgi:hypothetical protein